MAEDGADEIGPNIDASATGGDAPSGPGPMPGGAPPGGPPGGGPILNALAQRMRGPQVSAPGPGDQASAQTMIMHAIGMLQAALPNLPPGSPLHKDVLNAASRLSRHVPQGAPAAGVQQTQLGDLLKNVVKNALLQRIMAQQKPQQGGGGGQSAGPSPLPGAMAQAPMPSTPLPGA
jgi:hypothetical protein